MMEKYGVDVSKKEPTEDQLKKLSASGKPFKMPGSYKEASEMIAELEKTAEEKQFIIKK